MATRGELTISLNVDGPTGPTLVYAPAPITWAPAAAVLNGQQAIVSLTTGETVVTLPTGTVRVIIDVGANTNVRFRTAAGETSLVLGIGPTVLSLSGVTSFVLLCSTGTASVEVVVA